MSIYQDAIIAGFGGQGVMLMGTLLAVSAMESDMEVTYIPVYGPEMRGGTANCTVVISDEEIGSPIIRRPLSLIAMNRPSLEKFQPLVRDNGVVLINSSLVEPDLTDNGRIRAFSVPVNDIAAELGNLRLANMVALGAYVRITGIIALEAVIKSLSRVIPERYHHLLGHNTRALEAGAAEIRDKYPSGG